MPPCRSGSATRTTSDGGRELLNIFIAEARGDLRPVRRPERGRCWAAPRCWPTSRSSPPTTGCGTCSSSPSGATCCNRRWTRAGRPGLTITIGGENPDPRLADFTLVTSAYRAGDLSGVIGVIGPTRMPYDKIIGLVDHTSRLVEGSDGVSEFYDLLGVDARRVRGRHQEGLSQARDGIPSGPQPRRRRPRPDSRRSPRRTRCCAIPRSARRTTATARRAWAVAVGGRLPPRRSDRGAQHLHARLRRRSTRCSAAGETRPRCAGARTSGSRSSSRWPRWPPAPSGPSSSRRLTRCTSL